jgi:D-alanyl-D-alanine carboxypeptidase/D-alanyl-D-alanine-endopeptidase (penicillin-binding protein 4)
VKIILKTFLSTLFYFSMLITQAVASEKTDTDWRTLVTTYKLPYADQSYCFTDEQGRIHGENIDLRVRLASVSKVIVSLWAIDALGSDYKYETHLFIKGTNLHIAGGFDPFMGTEKMFFLLSQLNVLGYKNFDTITFDNNFLVFPNAAGTVEEYPVITKDTITKNLTNYFNTANWSPALKNLYNVINNRTKGHRLKKVVEMSAKEIKFSATNPFGDNSTARMLTLSSPPLFKYLKQVNVESNNFVAHTIFLNLGGEQKLENFLSMRYGLTSETLHFYSGSGLPTMINNVRFDNYATCSSLISLVEALRTTAVGQGHNLEDIMAVPGSDAGTFKNRIFPEEYKNAFVAKTGTLMHTSTIAGAMSTPLGLNFYGIFNQSTDIESSKMVQNAMVRSIMTDLGGPKAFNYTIEDFIPYGPDNVRGFADISSPNEFAPYEADLY